MTEIKTTKLQGSSYKVKGRTARGQKFVVRLPTEWVKKLGLEKGSPLVLQLKRNGILIKKSEEP